MNKLKMKKYDIALIVSFLIVFSCIYVPLILKDKMYMYIDIGADSYCSYWPHLAYSTKLIRDFSWYDFRLGLGSSTVLTVAYFLLDPFTWIAYFFEAIDLDIVIYIALIMKNIVLLFFSYSYLKKMKLQGWALNIATLSICFSGWFVGMGQHYNFATVFVLFIGMLYGFERWLQDKKWFFFIIMEGYLAIKSPYFCYMALLFLAVYYLVRFYQENGVCDIKQFLIHGFTTALLCLSGLGLAGVLFIPALGEITNGARVNGGIRPTNLFVTLKEYVTYIFRGLSNNILGINTNFQGYKNFYESPYMYVGLSSFFFLPVLFKRKNRNKSVSLVAILIITSIAFSNLTGVLCSAFSDMTYRWTFVLVPVLALGIGKGIEKWDDNIQIGRIQVGILVLLVLYLLYLIKNDIEIDAVVIYSVGTVLILTLFFGIGLKYYKRHKGIILIIICADLIFNGVGSVQMRSLISSTHKQDIPYFDNTQALCEKLEKSDSSFYRICKDYSQIDLNDSMIQGYNGERIYTSTLTKQHWNLQNIFDLGIKNSNYFYGFEDKQALRDITCGKYLISKDEYDYYGYDKVMTDKGYTVYKNRNAMNFGILFDSYILQSDFEKQNLSNRLNGLYYGCVLKDADVEKVERLHPKKYEDIEKLVPVEFSLKQEDGITYIDIDNNNNPLIIELAAIEKCAGNIYVSFDGEKYLEEKVKRLELNGEDKGYYYINLLNIKKIKIDFDINKLSEVCVYTQNVEQIEDIVAQKNANAMEVKLFSNSKISGKVDADKPTLLFLPILYNSGWSIFVNGSEKEQLEVNGGFIGVSLDAGVNNIELSFKPRGIDVGGMFSIVTAIVLICVYCRQIYLKRKTTYKCLT